MNKKKENQHKRVHTQKIITKKQARYVYKMAAALITMSIVTIIVGYFLISFVIDNIPARSVDIKVNCVIGEGFYKIDRGTSWEKAKIGMHLGSGYELKTASNSLMDIQISEDNYIRLSANSNMKFSKAKINDLSMKLTYGSLYGIMKKLRKIDKMSFETPTAVAAVRGTKICIEASSNKTNSYCLSGKLNVFNEDNKSNGVILHPNTKTSAFLNSSPIKAKKMTTSEIIRITNVLNSIYQTEALFASNHINFEIGSSEVLAESYVELKEIYETLLETGKRVRVEGNTDNSGDSSYNKVLSLNRAKAIKDYLVNLGLSSDKIDVIGYGGERPLFSNKTAEGVKLNRRVDFIILK